MWGLFRQSFSIPIYSSSLVPQLCASMQSLIRSPHPIFHSEVRLRISPPKTAMIPKWLNTVVSEAVMKTAWFYPVLLTESHILFIYTDM